MFTKLGVVIPLGAPGEFDDHETLHPHALLLDDRVLLYYTGYDGSKYRIGLAASNDGVHFIKLGVVLPLGIAGNFDDSRILNPAPVLFDGRIFLYYSGRRGANYRAGLAASNDGVHFVKLGVVIPLGAGGEFDDNRLHSPSPLPLDGRILLYYAGFQGTLVCIGLAASNDGVHFVKLGVVLPPGAGGEFDDISMSLPSPLLLNGQILLYYSGYNGNNNRVGLAASNDGVRFTRLGVVLPLGAAGDFDDTDTHASSPLLINGQVLLYYMGHNGDVNRIGLAASDRGV